MKTRKDTPIPSMQRTDPLPPLSLRPAAPRRNVTNSAPPAPRVKVRTKRAAKVHRGSPHETYNESNARSAADDSVPDGRISHDLSLTDNIRHSVVDNMLLSLNPDQSNLFSSSRDRPQFSAGSDGTSPPNSAHRHVHSSSLNSNFSFPPEDIPVRPSNPFPRGRRSNSSTNFQSALSRINSIHVEGETADVRRAETFSAKQLAPGGARPSSRTGRKSSKSSGASSIDFGQMAGPLRFPHSVGRRSASFDQGDSKRSLRPASISSTQPPLPSVLSQPIFYDDLEAAPTPTVPAGPRKDRTNPFPRYPPHAAPVVMIPQRKNSNKSSKSYMGRKKKTDNVSCNAPISVNANTWSGRRGSRQVQPVPTFTRSRNTSPVKYYSEPLITHRVENGVSAKDTAKDRPGFFRRVFGSSRGPMSAHGDSQAPQIPFVGGRGGTRANSRDGVVSPHILAKTSPSDELYHPPQDAMQAPLAKKPSSFFRRRKKSVCEAMPPPSLPYLQSNRTAIDSAQRSPVSSLRQVMNPYLDNPLRSDARQFAGTSEYDNGPLQTHTLQAKGSADPINLDYGTRQDAGFNDPLRQPRDVPAPKRETFTDRLHLKFNERTSSKYHDKSFFHDDSSNETRIPGVAEDRGLSRHESVKLDQAPTTTPKDMKLGKENARRQTRSREGAEPTLQRSIDSPKDRTVLSTLNGNLPASPRPSNATLSKAESRDWLTPAQVTKPVSAPAFTKDSDHRLWLQPSNSEEGLRKSDITLPIEHVEVSPVSDYQSAFSTLPASNTSGDLHFPEPTAESVAHKISTELDPTQPTAADRVQAKQLYDGDESLAPKPMAAAWLGEPGLERARIRQAYMELFEWQNLNILAALRGLCGRLYLKGEAQQVDRILDAFSIRWCACNSNHGFKASDVVHTICFSVLLLNTDLHQAEIETKMTRQQFLKNILPTVRRVVIDAAPDAFTNVRASTLPPARSLADSSRTTVVKSATFHEPPEPRRSFDGPRPIHRLSQRPSDQTVYTSTPPQSPLDLNTSLGDTGPLVKTPFHGKLSTWENQVEVVLKDFYNSIRQESLPLHGAENKEPNPEVPQPSNSLSVMTNNMLRRTPSVLSRTGSENISYSRGRAPENRLGAGKWQSKTRSRPRLYPTSTLASSRRSSIDEQSSVTTPSITSAWSKFSSFGKTQTSLSIDSFANNFSHGDYKQSIGFANALSQAIIREEGVGGDDEPLRAAPLLEDESLELAGAPWAKEGMVKHKYHLEAVEKKAKDRNWADRFAVIEKGYMRLFSFQMNAKSLRQKAKHLKASGGVVGGGNWADSAETLGTFLLRHTIASALPPPGYSKTRPHVWALSLPTGAVHFFQVGTPEIVKEFVSTANYWSARLSKEPMIGGISNIEYGWSETVINVSLLNADRNMSTSVVVGTGARPSLQSSIRSTRSSIDQGVYRARLPGDRVIITDWTPPPQSLAASVLMEVDQLKNLLTYVQSITDELEKHNELRAAMLFAFSPRHPNATKAMSNWERKSSYLLREIVKFRTYIDCLQAAQAHKETIYAEREKAALIDETTITKDKAEAIDS